MDSGEQAVERIKQGRYHDCEKCGAEIFDKRLVAIPYTTLCIDCAKISIDS